MRRILPIILSLLFFVSIASVVLAQSGHRRGQRSSERMRGLREARQEQQEGRRGVLQERSDNRKEKREVRQEKREEKREARREDRQEKRHEKKVQRRAARHERRKELRQKAKERRSARRAQIKERREARQEANRERRKKLKMRIQAFHNERRREVALRLEEKLAQVHERRINVFRDYLIRLEAILAKIDARASYAAALGRDVPTDLTAPAADAIAAGWDAVEAQAGQSYVPEFDDENEARVGFGASIQAMQTDLRATHDALIDAQRAVADAAHALAAVPSVDDDEALEAEEGSK